MSDDTDISEAVCDGLSASCTHCAGCTDCSRTKLHCFNYLDDIPGGCADSEWVEVQFKNTRKGYYRNSQHIKLAIGDIVAVEASPGHDIGTVTLTGLLAEMRMHKAASRSKTPMETKRVFRIAKDTDIEKYNEARSREDDTMVRSRKIAESLGLSMKIGDVEYQGDGSKAIFYYIADERVDFRQLIKVLAETFRVRIEMKQIGARQEAGRIGGIGPCGRPLCCSTWMTNFVSVSTSAARYQDITLNPQKLAGQCAKLKCCLNFEVDAYVDAIRKMPPKETRLETASTVYYAFKSDVFNRTMTFSTEKGTATDLVTISAERVFEVMAMNKDGNKPESLLTEQEADTKAKKGFVDILDDGDLTRFDKKKKKKRKGAGKPERLRAADSRAEHPNDGNNADTGAERQATDTRDGRRFKYKRHKQHNNGGNGNNGGNSEPQ